MDDIANAGNMAKQSAGVDFEQLKKFYFYVMSSTMEASEIQVLNGRAALKLQVIAEYYRPDSMTD
jgi:hypothetical protein